MVTSQSVRESGVGGSKLSVAQAGFSPSLDVVSVAFFDPSTGQYSASTPPTVVAGQEVGLSCRLRNTQTFPCYYAVYMNVSRPDFTQFTLPATPDVSRFELVPVSGGVDDTTTYSAPWEIKFIADQVGPYSCYLVVYSGTVQDLYQMYGAVRGPYTMASVGHRLAGEIILVVFYNPRTNEWEQTIPAMYLNESLQFRVYVENSSTAIIESRLEAEYTKPSEATGTLVGVGDIPPGVGLGGDWTFGESVMVLDELGYWCLKITFLGKIK